MRLGYYAGLVVLLALLGLGSHAWRMRGESRDDEQAYPPRAAMSVQMPTLAPVPAMTPEPVVWTWNPNYRS